MKRRHLSDDAKRLVWRRRLRRDRRPGRTSRTARDRQRRPAPRSPSTLCVEEWDRVAAPQLAAEVWLPGPGGRREAATGGALIMQGGVEASHFARLCRRSRADGVTGLVPGTRPTARRLRRSMRHSAGVERKLSIQKLDLFYMSCFKN